MVQSSFYRGRLPEIVGPAVEGPYEKVLMEEVLDFCLMCLWLQSLQLFKVDPSLKEESFTSCAVSAV